jgi:cell division GTPase FtsZ
MRPQAEASETPLTQWVRSFAAAAVIRGRGLQDGATKAVTEKLQTAGFKDVRSMTSASGWSWMVVGLAKPEDLARVQSVINNADLKIHAWKDPKNL